VTYLSFTVAAWFRYLNGVDEKGQPLPLDDPMAATLKEKAQAGGNDPAPLLNIAALFGDLSESERFTSAVTNHLKQLYTSGTQAVLEDLLAASSRR